jgi:hypothetical protein
MENMFEKGCLVQFSAGVWGASRKIKPEQLTDKNVSTEWLRASKKLIDPDAIKPVQKIINATRSYLTSASLPFPIHGMVFAPKEMVSRLDEKLNEFKTEFFTKVDNFIDNYDHLRQIAMVHLGELFSETDYPIDIRNKFSFIWRFVILDVPNGNTAILAPEVYEREKEKFIHTMEEARQLAVQSLREEFAGMIERITERFSTNGGAPKIFKNSTVNNFYEYFETFKQRNIFKDTELEEIVARAQAILGGKSAEDIRNNENLKNRIGTSMQEVEKAMAEVFTMPRRKINMN